MPRSPKQGWSIINRFVRTAMQTPPLDPDVADTAPSDSVLTAYDEEHLITYLRLLDADMDDADWREVARVVLHLDPEHESDRAWRAFESHLSRAKWMTEHGYRHLLRGGASA
jgi:type VI secretion system activator RovC-like protein